MNLITLHYRPNVSSASFARWMIACVVCTCVLTGFVSSSRSLVAQDHVAENAGSIAGAAMRTPLYGSDPKFNRNPDRKIQTASHTQSIDADSRWQFVVIENAFTDSTIIRLEDVIRPMHNHTASWSRLSKATIGLMPLDGSPAKISRDRLADLIVSAEATASRIRILGDETIVVRPSDPATSTSPQAIQTHAGSYDTASVNRLPQPATTTGVSHAVHSVGMDSDQGVLSNTFGSNDALDIETRERIEQWVRWAIQNHYRELDAAFVLEPELNVHEIGSLSDMQGIREVRFVDPIPVWSPTDGASVTCRLHLDARAASPNCQGVVRVRFTPKPPIVMARQPLQRGHRVGPGDVHLQPSPDMELSNDLVADLNEVIGMEVVGLIRSGIPLRPQDFAAPRLVRRGDLVEVQVTGGGIRVTTSAKALGDGAQNELIEIETLTPKRRLLAKVVEPSIVEIVTQPNRVPTTKTTRKWQPTR
ncbi:flagellar basal body P-ring formation chaperone FlgA [Rhodopirellula sp. JC737]|nr:flagellar basal body P-ring formation chaperone FlgA [Rhodopirellula sp. JC737]